MRTGGKKQEMVVTVEDSNKGLNYVAALLLLSVRSDCQL